MSYADPTPEVLALADFAPEGNVIDHHWYQHIKNPDGKLNSLAVLFLGDIVWWYRPVVERDEATGKIVGYRKKFKGDLLQRSKNALCETFGCSYKQARGALDLLTDLGLIEIVLRNQQDLQGRLMTNVPYIKIYPEEIKRISRPLPLRSEGSDLKVIGVCSVGQTNTEISNTENSNTEISRSDPYKRKLFLSQKEEKSTDLDPEEEGKRIDIRLVGSDRVRNENRSKEEWPEEEFDPESLDWPRQSDEDLQISTKGLDRINVPLPQFSEQRKEKPILGATRFDFDQDGWLQFPRAKKWGVARKIATLRLQYWLATEIMGDHFEVDDSGDRWMFYSTKSEDFAQEGEFFDARGGQNLKALRNYANAHFELSQGDFNANAETFFVEALEWIENHGIGQAVELLASDRVCEYFEGRQDVSYG